MKVGRPLKFKNVEELQNAIDAYFLSCEDPERPGFYIKPLTITSLAVHLDTTRDLLLDYQEKDEFSDTIKKAKQFIHAWTEEQLYRNTQVTGVIFNLKNNYGWKDKTEQDITSAGKPIPLMNNVLTNNQSQEDSSAD